MYAHTTKLTTENKKALALDFIKTIPTNFLF